MTKRQKIGVIIGTTLSIVMMSSIIVPTIIVSSDIGKPILITKDMSQNIYDSIVNDIPIGKTSLEQLNSTENVNKTKEKISNIMNVSTNDILSVVFIDTNIFNKANVSITFDNNIRFILEDDNQFFERNNNSLTTLKSFCYGNPSQTITTEIEKFFDNTINSYINSNKVYIQNNDYVDLISINNSSNLNNLIDDLNSFLTNNNIVNIAKISFTINDLNDGLDVSLVFDNQVNVSGKGNYVQGQNKNTLNSKSNFPANILDNITNQYLNMFDISAISKDLINYGDSAKNIVNTLQNNQEIFYQFIKKHFLINDEKFTASINESQKVGAIELTVCFANSPSFIQIDVYPLLGNQVVDKYFIINGSILVGLTEEGKQQSELDLSNLSIYSIGENAFSNCNSLTTINISNKIKSIGSKAFFNCSSLSTITIPSSVTSIGVDAFNSCSNLIWVTIPNSVTSIGNGAFANCVSLTSINIPNSVSLINDYTFSNCKKLGGIYIPNSVTRIGNSAFYGCSSFTSISIPNSVTYIGSYVFSNCSSLTSIDISNGITSIDGGIFSSCSSLTSITIPSSVTTFDLSAFNYCTNLSNIYFERNSKLNSIGGKIYGAPSLKLVDFSNCKPFEGDQASRIQGDNPYIQFIFPRK